MSSEVVELLRTMIRDECVNTGLPESGHEHRSVATLHEFFGVEGHVFEPAPGRQSLVYRVAGTDPEAPSLAMVGAMGSAGESVVIESRSDNPASISSTDTTMWAAIADAVFELEGHRELIPALMPVATDARFWRKRGTAAYGVGLYDEQTGFSDLLSRFHGHDERVSIESVERTAALYERILFHLGAS